MDLKLKTAGECRYDAVSIGEVMLRLDPGEGRIRTARSFQAWEGGGEYNVVRGLRRCFGMRTAVLTAFADNEVGRLMEDLILQGGVDTQFIKWMKTDGIGRTCRNGLNFTERGFGIRGALGCSDRANTAISKARPEDFDLDYIFGEAGVRWLHTGGIYAALSEQSCETVIEAIRTAKKYGTVREAMKVGHDDQIVLKHHPEQYPSFSVRNIAASGRVWTGVGTNEYSEMPSAEEMLQHASSSDWAVGENIYSGAFHLKYGSFDYFAGGDHQYNGRSTYAWKDIEAPMAKVRAIQVSPVFSMAL